jgi:hypothetical protein
VAGIGIVVVGIEEFGMVVELEIGIVEMIEVDIQGTEIVPGVMQRRDLLALKRGKLETAVAVQKGFVGCDGVFQETGNN